MNLKNVTSFKTESGLEIQRAPTGIIVRNSDGVLIAEFPPAELAALVTAAKAWGLTGNKA